MRQPHTESRGEDYRFTYMIDKTKFNEIFDNFDRETTIQILDIANEQLPEILKMMKQNIDDQNFGELLFSACHMRGICSSFFEPVSYDCIQRIVQGSNKRIFEILQQFLSEYPKALENLHHDNWEYDRAFKVLHSSSIEKYLTEITGGLQERSIENLRKLEREIMDDEFRPLFSELEIAVKSFLDELVIIKQEITSAQPL